MLNPTIFVFWLMRLFVFLMYVLQDFLDKHQGLILDFTFSHFALQMWSNLAESFLNIINFLWRGKYHIHYIKWRGSKPSFPCFMHDLEIKTMQTWKNCQNNLLTNLFLIFVLVCSFFMCSSFILPQYFQGFWSSVDDCVFCVQWRKRISRNVGPPPFFHIAEADVSPVCRVERCHHNTLQTECQMHKLH